ncbi:MAG TPA: hypothetical protein VGP72_32040 [Planctomycetota bacterium]
MSGPVINIPIQIAGAGDAKTTLRDMRADLRDINKDLKKAVDAGDKAKVGELKNQFQEQSKKLKEFELKYQEKVSEERAMERWGERFSGPRDIRKMFGAAREGFREGGAEGAALKVTEEAAKEVAKEGVRAIFKDIATAKSTGMDMKGLVGVGASSIVTNLGPAAILYAGAKAIEAYKEQQKYDFELAEEEKKGLTDKWGHKRKRKGVEGELDNLNDLGLDSKKIREDIEDEEYSFTEGPGAWAKRKLGMQYRTEAGDKAVEERLKKAEEQGKLREKGYEQLKHGDFEEARETLGKAQLQGTKEGRELIKKREALEEQRKSLVELVGEEGFEQKMGEGYRNAELMLQKEEQAMWKDPSTVWVGVEVAKEARKNWALSNCKLAGPRTGE